MFKPIARITLRSDGLILGEVLISAKEVLKSEVIYEIREILGELVICEIGVSAIKSERHPNRLKELHWGSTVNSILDKRAIHLLTEEEYQDLIPEPLDD